MFYMSILRESSYRQKIKSRQINHAVDNENDGPRINTPKWRNYNSSCFIVYYIKQMSHT